VIALVIGCVRPAAREFDRHIVFSVPVMRDDFRAGEEM